jgi:phospholipase D1/2
MCVIDEAIAFTGGVDLCFGRWDTAQHALIDEGDIPGENAEQIWKGEFLANSVWLDFFSDFSFAGKDYSNARVSDFHTLNKPEQDMYDRSKVARMPW